MTKPIHIWFEQTHDQGDLVRRLIFEDVEGPDGPRCESWWRVPGVIDHPDLPVLDSLVCAHIQWAATLGQDLVVHGPVSAGGLYNMNQLLQFRCALTPLRYRRPVSILPDRVITGAFSSQPSQRVVVAYSGGLDSTFSVVRHAYRLAGEASYAIAGLVLVHGFDVPLHMGDRFDALRRRLAPLADALGLPLYTISTNSMMLGGRVWPHSAMPLFGGALVNFTFLSTQAMVSSGTPHGVPKFASIAHGSHLDSFCSNDYFRMITDGGGYTRADKAEALLPYPEAVKTVKVCWQGSDPSSNCGVCPKCVMTRIDFLAAGLRNPSCFSEPLTLDHIALLNLPSTVIARDFFRFCWSEIMERGVTGPEVTLLRQRLSRVPPEFLALLVDRWAKRIRYVVPDGIRRKIHQTLARVT